MLLNKFNKIFKINKSIIKMIKIIKYHKISKGFKFLKKKINKVMISNSFSVIRKLNL